MAYHVSYNVSSSEEEALDTNTTKNVTVAGLDEYTVYGFVLYASTRIGDGPSTTILGRTNESCKQSYVLLYEQLSDVTREKNCPFLMATTQIRILLRGMFKCSVLESGLHMCPGSLH